MTFEEFETFCKGVQGYNEPGQRWPTNEWLCGGRSGGSCYDEGLPTYYSLTPDPQPEDEFLSKVLEELAPNTTFLQYKKIENSDIVKFVDRYQNEYYGNHSEYRHREHDLRKLYDLLKGWNYL